ncbi:hypothetical protein DERF_008993 [Dermatophagoides farinae]|uniref:Uncharacterized protein n=1 Tax=Dermatophagoides farinae TaxID=6954 RepID=A0A922L588_DERFA|nr:hypothetical protein DERF_008993 [Dermatophagoides farinae]
MNGIRLSTGTKIKFDEVDVRIFGSRITPQKLRQFRRIMATIRPNGFGFIVLLWWFLASSPSSSPINSSSKIVS